MVTGGVEPEQAAGPTSLENYQTFRCKNDRCSQYEVFMRP